MRRLRLCLHLKVRGGAPLTSVVGSAMPRFSSVRFTVDEFGDDPVVITRLIGFEPTSIATCGWTSLPQQTSWQAGLPKATSDKLEDQIAALLRLLESHSQGVRAVAAKFRARIAISVDDRDWISPHDSDGYRSGGFEIPPEVSAAASRLGLGIEIHFFTGLERKDE